MTTPYRKPFNKEMYDMFDGLVKDEMMNILSQEGHQIVRSSENYGVDIVSKKNGDTYYSEGEMKSSWKDHWPLSWREIRIPERKVKLLNKYDNLDFYIFNFNLSKCWRIGQSLLTPERCKEAYGKRIKYGEQFFHIPYEEAELLILK